MDWIWIILGIIALIVIGAISVVKWTGRTAKRGFNYFYDRRRKEEKSL